MTSTAQKGWFNPEATTFGDRVAGAREQAGMTQQALARRLGVKTTTLEDWENDLAEPRANRLSMMAGLLNVSFRWLLTGEGQGPGGADADTVQPEAAALLAEMRDIGVQMRLNSERLNRVEKKLLSLLREPADA